VDHALKTLSGTALPRVPRPHYTGSGRRICNFNYASALSNISKPGKINARQCMGIDRARFRLRDAGDFRAVDEYRA